MRVRSEALLAGRVEALTHELSDANLQQVPELTFVSSCVH